ncbi:unnamed protein product, partial [marine sediment metagenome]
MANGTAEEVEKMRLKRGWELQPAWHRGAGYGEEWPAFDVDAWLQGMSGEYWPGWTPGFKWPWQTPAGEGFQAPWTSIKPEAPAGEAGMPQGFWASPYEIPPEVLARYDIVYDPDMMAWRIGNIKAGTGMGAQIASWGTISEGGWDYYVGYDAEGNEVAREPLGRTETAEMSEYERE